SERWLNSASPVRHSEWMRASTDASPNGSPSARATCSLPVAGSAKAWIRKTAQGVGSWLEATYWRMPPSARGAASEVVTMGKASWKEWNGLESNTLAARGG